MLEYSGMSIIKWVLVVLALAFLLMNLKLLYRIVVDNEMISDNDKAIKLHLFMKVFYCGYAVLNIILCAVILFYIYKNVTETDVDEKMKSVYITIPLLISTVSIVKRRMDATHSLLNRIEKSLNFFHKKKTEICKNSRS